MIPPHHVAYEEIATAVHILNGTLSKLNFHDHPELYGIFEDPTPILKKEENLEERCREFLMGLPKKVTIDNWVSFVELPQKYNLPSFGYNLNAVLTRKLRETLNILWDFLGVL